jgi:predicted phage terminase large subunit-like protein
MSLLQNYLSENYDKDLMAFLYKSSKGKYKFPAHIKLIINELEQLVEKKNQRIIVTLPPRHGKSELISKYFPAWHVIKYPDKRILLASYESSFATSWSYKALQIYKEYRNDLVIEKQDDWRNKSGGGVNAVGVGGSMTGKGADLIIIDDPVKNAEEANSTTYRKKAMDWFNSTAYTRLEPNGNFIILQTRWHEDDLAGHLIKEMEDGGESWKVINIPAIAYPNDILGREEGEALWSERFPIERLEVIKKQLGSYWFNSLYQQKPTSNETEIIKRQYWQFFEEEPTFNFICQSWDTAFKDGEFNDYSVGLTFGLASNGFYLIDSIISKLEYPDLKNQILLASSKYKPNVILIEDKASGQSLVQDLKRSTRLPILPIKPQGDKTTRVYLITPLFEAKKVFIRLNDPNTVRIINECAEFPFSAHDDIVDAISQALTYLKYKLNNTASNNNYIPKRESREKFNINGF